MCLLCIILHHCLGSLRLKKKWSLALSTVYFQENFFMISLDLRKQQGKESFYYANIKIIKVGEHTPDRFNESSASFSIFTACNQIKFQIIFSKRITTFKLYAAKPNYICLVLCFGSFTGKSFGIANMKFLVFIISHTLVGTQNQLP